MEQQTYEREIDLILLAKEIIKKYKTIAVVGIISAAILGIIGMLRLVRDYNNPEVMDYQRAEYQDALNEYNAEITSLNREIESLKTSIKRQKEYNEKSVLMKIDPLAVQNGILQYYVDAGYIINTDLVYQTLDDTASALAAYLANVNNGDLWKYLYDNMEESIEFRYIQELVSVSVNYDNHMVNVAVKARTEEECREILNLIKECFDTYQKIINEAVCEHDMVLVSECIYGMADTELEDEQKENIEKIADYEVTLVAREFELKQLLLEENKPVNTVLSLRSIVTGTSKWLIIGSILGVFVSAAVICVMLLLDVTIKSDKDVAFYLELPVLAEVPVISGEDKKMAVLRKNKKARLNQYGDVM